MSLPEPGPSAGPPPLPPPLPGTPSGPDPADGVRTTTADGQWHRVHPFTPAIRSWQALIVVVAFAAQSLVTGIGPDGGLPPGVPAEGPGTLVLLIGSGVVVLGLAVAFGLATLSWRMTRYRITRDSIEVRRGVLFRQHRRAQLDRIQAVDVVQPLLARVTGLARLKVEVAGAGSSHLELSFIGEPLAQRLRNQLLAGAAGLEDRTEDAPVAPEHHWLEVPLGRLLLSILLSGPALSLLAFGLTMVALAPFMGGVPLAGVLPALLGAGGLLWAQLSRGFGFRASVSPDGLRLRHGLLEQRSQTLPPGRIQAIRLSQSLLWRPMGWWRVQVNVAGYGPQTAANEQESVVLPVGTRDEAVAVLWFVVPDLGAGDDAPGEVVDAALTGTGPASGFVTSPRRARWLDPFAWRRNGFRLTGTVLLVRSGVLGRETVVVPHARTQSLGVTQGPLERRLGLADFVLHSTPGPVAPRVRHLDAAVAGGLLDDQAARARRARADAGPERWMQRPVPPAPG